MTKSWMGKSRYAMLLAVPAVLCWWWFDGYIDCGFATEAVLRYRCHEGDDETTLVVTDESDVLVLKQVLSGYAMRDSPSCGFGDDLSVTMSDGRKRIVLQIASDGCSVVCIGGSNRCIGMSDEAGKRLHDVLAKYGMTFPCI